MVVIAAVVLGIVNTVLFFMALVFAGADEIDPPPGARFAGQVAWVLLAPYWICRDLPGYVGLGYFDEGLGFVLAIAVEAAVVTSLIFLWRRRKAQTAQRRSGN
jgi:hypothetical protein